MVEGLGSLTGAGSTATAQAEPVVEEKPKAPEATAPPEPESRKPEATPEPDPEVRYKTLEAENKRLADALKREQGRLRKQDEVPPWVLELQRQQKALRNRLDLMTDMQLQGDDADPAKAKERLKAATEEEQRQAAQERDMRRYQRWEGRLLTTAKQLDLDFRTDPRTLELVQRWNTAAAKGDIDAVEDCYNDLTDALSEIRERAAEERAQERHRERVNEERASGKLRTDSGQSGGAGARSTQDLVDRLGWGEPLNEAEAAQAAKGLNEGLRPRARPRTKE